MAEPTELSSYARITLMQMQSQIGIIQVDDPTMTQLNNGIATLCIQLGSDVGIEKDLREMTAEISHLEDIRIAIDTANRSAQNKINLAKLIDPAKLSADQIRHLQTLKTTQENLIAELTKIVKEINNATDKPAFIHNSQVEASIDKRVAAQKKQIDDVSKNVKVTAKQIEYAEQECITLYKSQYSTIENAASLSLPSPTALAERRKETAVPAPSIGRSGQTAAPSRKLE